MWIFQKCGNFIFSATRRYFNKIKQEEASIGEIVEILNKEKNILTNDNVTLEIEINRLSDIIEKLNKEYENGNVFKDEINSIIENLKEEQENRAKLYKKNILAPLEEKLYDIKQMILVKEQSMLALEIIRRNNKEINRNIDKVKNVTIVALNTAVMVAKSLYNQKLVLKKINTLENGAGNIINSTGVTLKKYGAEIYNVASNDSTVQSLQEAFNEALNTIREVDSQNKKTFPENEIQIIELKKDRG